jgi:ribosome-binding protein aMBF1 (putative translation factor)
MIGNKIWCCAEARPESELPAVWRDNVYTKCELCNRAVMHRPHADADSSKVCMECTKLLAKAMRHDEGEPQIRVTEQGHKEFVAMHGEAKAKEAIEIAKRWITDLDGDDD